MGPMRRTHTVPAAQRAREFACVPVHAAAYDHQVGQEEPCGYIHNGIHMRQILYDALDDLDGGGQDDSVGGHTRP